ncbi:MAG: homoserine kinase [Rhodocyclaceae bacterium]|nr:homoserine kinase [Rhodocyclaceae bacterium]
MSVFTPVSRAEAESLLSGYDIGELVGLEGIAAGIENTNYFLDTQAGRFVLTLFEKLSVAELPFYLGLMAHLAARGVSCPAPVADRRGRTLTMVNGRPACIVTRLRGASVDTPETIHCAAVGASLARMHLAGADFGMQMDNPRGPRWWHEAAGLIDRFLDPPQRDLLRSELDYQDAVRAAELPRGVVHADLFRDNVLFEDTRVGGLIDFYFACTDVWLFDVAVTLNDWCLASEAAVDAGRANAFLAAYAGVRSFTDVERCLWPVMLRAGALRFWLSRLCDFHLPRAGEMTHAKDPGHFERLLRVHRNGPLPPLP